MSQTHELFDYVEGKPKRGGVSLGVALSLAFHLAVLSYLIVQHLSTPPVEQNLPSRYVEFLPVAVAAAPNAASLPIIEAPGPAVQSAPRNAPLSDANRRASTPQPTGPNPTRMPGSGQGMFDGGPRGEGQQQATAPAEQSAPQDPQDSRMQPYRDSVPTRIASVAPDVDWDAAIRDAGTLPSTGGRGTSGDWRNGMGQLGGDAGTAETGPLSFETQWFEWGDYSLGMIRRIRVHWYENMPHIIRMGVKGMATIRFTIQRDGTVTNIELIASSGVPPYDNAALRAIELASPLAPLPANFPKASERVTARFFYNMKPQ